MNYNLSPTHKLYILLLIILLIIIVYKLYTTSSYQIEHFESVLSRLRSSKKDKKDNIKVDTKINKTNKSETFDNIMKRSEDFKKQKDNMGDFMSSFNKFKNSFTKEKFKNNSKSTGEALKKFSLYKTKFFEIFD